MVRRFPDPSSPFACQYSRLLAAIRSFPSAVRTVEKQLPATGGTSPFTGEPNKLELQGVIYCKCLRIREVDGKQLQNRQSASEKGPSGNVLEQLF